jgi:hypothetical protein
MACQSPWLFRHRQTCQYWVAACQRFACASCIHRVARRWRAILNRASAHGAAPEYFLTLTLREPLPLWRQAPAAQQEAMRKQALALAERLTRALSRLVEEVREQYGPMEYLAVVELTTGKRTPGHRPPCSTGLRLRSWWCTRRRACHGIRWRRRTTTSTWGTRRTCPMRSGTGSG